MNDTAERLADYAHTAWSGWMEYLFDKGHANPDGTFTINADSVERWRRQMGTPYKQLPETEKESDRDEAAKIAIQVGPAMLSPWKIRLVSAAKKGAAENTGAA